MILGLCSCGHEAVLKLFVSFRYPRAEYLPEAVDPYYVQGGGGFIETCGNPQCEADAYLARREEIISLPCPWLPSMRLPPEQVDGLEMWLQVSPEDGITVIGGEADA